jgi:alcohol dehydrogenase class IV
MPPAVTASTGLDALTQVLEPFVSRRATPMTDGICREGMARAARSLQRAYRRGDDAEAREDMALVSLFGGLALANAGLGAVHGIAGPLGGMFRAPHGALCARLLPAVVQMNLAALRERATGSATLDRYDEVGRILTGCGDARAEEGVAWLREVVAELAVPSLRSYGIGESDLDEVAGGARVASSMKGNPIELSGEELREVLLAAL